ncbi:short-chain dehydrogenase/reductase SDR [Halorubrum aidingense JCM 13560]|uniref:Short-chain dehydrogenase/reductase SDR n=1 Tax=Halorubrum aidingense JCM 13560 TaxID=1230454 RepID=M0PKG9_9EURY|nr:SDR family oxidoreductase [Halorubrum aidingense]EMA70507.1 short-chain dehydrogenase/reductase SDR [Halorubrum aidingense JCM 13560]
MELGLSGASVFVAAASKGLGLGAATQFAAEGANVAIASRSADNLAAARESILEETGCDDDAVFTVEMDLADADAIESGIAAAIEAFGGLDVLVTNHGGPNNASFEDTPLEAFDGGYNDVLRSTVVQCKAALPALRDGGGAVTHLVAASAAEPTAHGTLGNVFRPGIYGLSKTLANEEGKNGVRSNCVAPRGVLSDRIESKIAARAEREGLTEAEVRELRVAELPLPEMGTTEEFGKAVAFVSSPAASYVTGSVLPVDGGWSSRLL